MGTTPTGDTGIIGISPRQTNARTWKYRVHNKGRYSAQYMLQSPNTFGSVRRRKFGLICISSESCLWSNVRFARLLGLPPYVPFLSAKAAKGELLRLCPGYSRRAPQYRKPKTDCHDIARDCSTTRRLIGIFIIPPH